MKSWRVSVVRPLLDLLFPIACLGCGRVVQATRNFSEAEQWLCATCVSRLQADRPRCLVCETFTPTGRTCASCLFSTPLMGTVATGPYHDPVLQSAILHLKFHGIRSLAQPLGLRLAAQLIARGVISAPASATLVPLPLHARRERSRGYNQAHLIAEVIAEQTGVSLRSLLVRARATEPQTRLMGTGRARRENLRGAFHCSATAPLNPETRYILIDDVVTSGATIMEAARTLAEHSAHDLWAGVVARG